MAKIPRTQTILPKEGIFLLTGLGVGVVLTAGIFSIIGANSTTTKPLRESDISSSSGYKFTDPLLGITSGEQDSSTYADLEQKVDTFLAQQQKSGLTMASVNFRDILASQGFTLNPTQTYNPASLLKVPVMMAYYDLSDNDPGVLQQTVVYSGQHDLDADEQLRSPTQLVPGTEYTVEELIEHMIKYSDNNALQLLSDHLDTIGKKDVLVNLFNNLGLSYQDVSTNIESTNIQQYSLFLRVLFNATYLNRDYSEKALDLMTQTDFAEGIESGVPNTVEVAQKYGDGKIADQNGTITGAELQNCGIVYYPNHPYLLCIMTKGSTVTDLTKTLQGVSKIIYQAMESKYPVQ